MPPKRPDGTGWENLREKSARGEFELIDPMDYMILELLPDEGELVMGYYPFTKDADTLVKERFTDMRPGQLAGNMRRLIIQGLVIRVRTRAAKSRSHGYQRTAQGRKLFDEWKKNQPPDKSGVGGKS